MNSQYQERLIIADELLNQIRENDYAGKSKISESKRIIGPN